MSARSVIALFVLVLSVVHASQVIDLTTDSFEHLTQAATGATTGDWLVEFYAPWCGHCKHLAPVYEEVAQELHGSVNVAKVDVTAHAALGKRFDIKGFPTILFFHKGAMYEYSNDRTKEALVEYATGGYASGVKKAVPGVPTFFDGLAQHVQVVQKDLKTLLGTKKNALLVTFSFGLLIGLILGCFCNCCSTSRDTPKQKRA